MIWISDQWKDYEVLDTSNGERLERWGKYILVRPDPQVDPLGRAHEVASAAGGKGRGPQ